MVYIEDGKGGEWADSDGGRGGEWFTLRMGREGSGLTVMVLGERCVSVAGGASDVGSRQSVHYLKGQCGQANASIALIYYVQRRVPLCLVAP